jgi:acylphosphatase
MRRELLELQAIVKGNVQGVGFRATVKSLADQLHLVGFTCNLPNGDVEICAQGEKERLEELLLRLQQKYKSQIHHVDRRYLSIEQSFSSFSIRR